MPKAYRGEDALQAYLVARLRAAGWGVAPATRKRKSAEWNAAHPDQFVHVHNEGFRRHGHTGKLFALGFSPGFLDLVIFARPPNYPHFGGTALELKMGSNKPNDAQERWLRLFAGLGWWSGWTQGEEAPVAILTSLGYLPPE